MRTRIRTSLDPHLEAPALEPAPALRGAPPAPSARLEATGAAPEPLEGASEAPRALEPERDNPARV